MQEFLSRTRDQLSQNIMKSIGNSNFVEEAMLYSALGNSKMIRASLVIASGKITTYSRGSNSKYQIMIESGMPNIEIKNINFFDLYKTKQKN